MSKELETLQGTTSDVLYAAAKFIALECATLNKKYYQCRKETRDPEHCLTQGADCTMCGLGVIEKLESQCAANFDAYKLCMYNTYTDLEKCRKQQRALEECWVKLEH
mmetsp:Transcript_15941/g.60760  ORF Transcript_15941/g.60760 Transcript_15941/m.60760 type:complete len:107 (-) Transcript_15941:170-490(-)